MILPLHASLPLAAVLLAMATGAARADADIFVRADATGAVELSNLPDGQDYQLLLAAPPPPPPPPVAKSEAAAVALPERAVPYRDLVAAAAAKAKVDAELLHAVIAVESDYNPAALSRRGAAGLMQLMPDTARRYGVRDRNDAGQNVQAGAQYLADLLHLFGNDLHLALAAYNAGEKAVLRFGSRIPPYRETVEYVPKVLAVYRKLKPLSI